MFFILLVDVLQRGRGFIFRVLLNLVQKIRSYRFTAKLKKKNFLHIFQKVTCGEI